MAIFSRRTLQRMLDENASFISQKQLQSHVDSLNSEGVSWERYLSYEWEVAVLNAWSRLGRVQHEASFGGSRVPDLHFSQPDVEALLDSLRSVSSEVARQIDSFVENAPPEASAEEPDDFAFVADIATISDLGLHEKNPIEAFVEEFGRLIEKKGLRFRSLSYQVGRRSRQEQTDPRSKLKLPPKGRFHVVIFGTPAFKDFLRAAQQHPNESHHVVLQNDEIDLTLGYDPNQRYFHGSGAAYRSVSHFDHDPKARSLFDRNLKNNAVYKTLSDKSQQLKGSGFAGRCGVILCDGGCQLLRDKGTMQTRTTPEVIRQFLEDSTSVDFVISVVVDWIDAPPAPRSGLTFSLMSYPSRNRVRRVQSFLDVNPRLLQTDEGREFAQGLLTLTLAAHLAFPTPVADADGSLARLKRAQNHEGLSFWGGSTVNSGSNGPVGIKIPARALMEFLSGAVEPEHFMTGHKFGPHENPITEKEEAGNNPFAAAFRQGCLIDTISIEKSVNEDDDWIVFRFSQPDAAIAPFRMPVASVDDADKDNPQDGIKLN